MGSLLSRGVRVVKKMPAFWIVSTLMAQFSMKKAQRTKTTSAAASPRTFSASWLLRISPCTASSVRKQ